MASSLDQSLLKAGWAWSHELLNAVVADLRDVGIRDAHHTVGARAARHPLHFQDALVLLCAAGLRLEDFASSEQWPEDIRKFMDKLFRVSLLCVLCVSSTSAC